MKVRADDELLCFNFYVNSLTCLSFIVCTMTSFFLQSDLEEAKTQENAKLQFVLQDMQSQF